MCGIAGIVGAAPLEIDIKAMVASQAHRGPDDHGLWLDEGAGVALGHNRLSIVDLSAAGHQPMTDGSGLWLTFNGEIYNYRELRAELAGYPFKSRTDTEVILAAWRRWGKECLARFIGMFAFAMWDEKSRTLFCARDRLGVKPFHYAWKEGRFLFASEAKAILAAGVPATPDMRTWATYLAHGIYDHSERTFFEGIQVLPAGHFAVLKDGRWTVQKYWDPVEGVWQPLRLPDEEAGEIFLDSLENSVRLRLRADVPVGINLSGGLDSSMIAALADQLLGEGEGHVETFTAGFGDARYDEECFADQIPRRTQWRRHIVRIEPDECWDLLRPGMWHQEAPFGGVATIAYHKLHAHARACGVTVLLEAQGADEILAGYPHFRAPYWRDLLESRQYLRLRAEWRAIPRDERRMWIDHTRRLMRRGGLSVHYDGTSHLSPDGLSADLIEIAGAEPTFDLPARTHLDAALWCDTRYKKLPRVLRMNDRLSMASSTELREPFLDHRVVEFAFRLPAEQKIRFGSGKYLQRHAMRGLLPSSLASQPKRMVVTPQREWLRGPLRRRVEELLASKRFAERGMFDARLAQSSFQAFARGVGDNSFFVWQWINAEMWFQTFIDDQRYRQKPDLAHVYGSVARNDEPTRLPSRL
jgi:asparagine synthase (glutamine-hydrolysing)